MNEDDIHRFNPENGPHPLEDAAAPTEKQLGYAEHLASELGIAVPLNALQHRGACGIFIGECQRRGA